MPPKKKGNGKKNDDKNEAERPLAFQPIVYITNKPATMIEMLDSPETKLLLRVIGTLHKAAIESDKTLEYLLSCGLYDKLLVLLKSPDVYILRFTLSFVKKVISKVINFSYNLDLTKTLATVSLVTELFLNQNDDLIKAFSTNILMNLAKFNQMISTGIYSSAVVSRIFDILKTDKQLELALDSVELLFHILESSKAQEEILSCNGFSLVTLLCMFESNHTVLTQLALDILHKLALWKRSDILLELGKAKIAEAMTRQLVSGAMGCCEKAFEITYACLSDDECIRDYVKSLEFVKYLEWVTRCPKASAAHAAVVLKLLSDRDDLLQVLFDFSMEDAAISLFRFPMEEVILDVCAVILNMMRHRYCCEKMATPALMKTLIEIVRQDDLFATDPYGQAALQTLHRFFQCYLNTVKSVKESGCIDMLVDVFVKSKKQLSDTGYIHIIEIMEILSKSQYSGDIRNIEMYQTIIDYYRDSSVESGQLLVIMASFFDCDEFRVIFLERDVLSMMMEKIIKRKDIQSSAEILVAIKKLITYKKIGLAFTDRGYLSQLLYIKDNFKFHTNIVDQIIDALFHFCLTMKFFYKHKLDENDKIRDQFMLIPDSFMAIETKNINFRAMKLSERVPIYVVCLQELMYDDLSTKSEDAMDLLEEPFFLGSAVLGQVESQQSPLHFLDVSSAKIIKSVDDVNSIPSRTDSLVGDINLARTIVDINDEIHEENPLAYRKLQTRIKYVADYINAKLSNSKTLEGYLEPRHALAQHIMQLIKALGTNFVPIGHLKIGFQCERALLFKVICDQVKIPTTLCKEGDVYFNEVGILKSDLHFHHGYLIQKMFIVDLMEDVGCLIPKGSIEAKAYLKRNSSVF